MFSNGLRWEDRPFRSYPSDTLYSVMSLDYQAFSALSSHLGSIFVLSYGRTDVRRRAPVTESNQN